MSEHVPKGLGDPGAALWRSILAALPPDDPEHPEDAVEFDERELATLELACRQADDVAALEAALEAIGSVWLEGSKGQPVLNPIVGELRQGRLALARLLGGLGLPNVDGRRVSAASARGRKAAEVRWSGVVTLDERRRRLKAGGTRGA
jgi:hypothetical protein